MEGENFNNNENQQSVNEGGFDPMTGQPVNNNNVGGFDPMTGQPVNNNNVGSFDPMTGQPVNNNNVGGFDPMTGQPVNNNNGNYYSNPGVQVNNNGNYYANNPYPNNGYQNNNVYAGNMSGDVPGKGAATASLVLGIMSLVCCLSMAGAVVGVILGIVGVICSSSAKKAGFVGGIQKGGFICSLIGIIAGCLIFVACVACVGALGAAEGLNYDYYFNY